jgi:carbonic anhydrase/acetyltransferase-like protein (isoleucine patch superfamily)
MNVGGVGQTLLVRMTSPHAVMAPLDEPVSDLLFGGMTPRAWVEAAALSCGLTVVTVARDEMLPAGTAIAVSDDVVVNAATILAIGRAARERGGVVQAAIAAGTALWDASARVGRGVAGESLSVSLWAGALAGLKGSDLIEGRHATAAVVAVADEDSAVVVDARPHGVAPHQLAIANVERLLGQPGHWLHVLDLSLAALQTRLQSTPGRVAMHRRRGQKAHPTARIERSIIGDNVTIEAHVSITDSVIGDDVIVADHSVIHGSVVGSGCRTLVDTHLRRVVAMPGSTLSNLDMQDAIFGREIFLTTGVAFFHDGPGHNVVVDGVDSGRALLGGAIGRRAVLGSRALFRCGVALPAGALVVARPEEAVGKLDPASLARAAMRFGDRASDV